MSAEIPDGDLVRLARDGDPAAFRLLVERHQPTVRTRARSLCGNQSDVDDVVQESFLRAFIGLDRLRDPDRFAGWLGSIVANVCRGLGRRAPVTLLPDWPEPLHPAAAHGLPSADDLDRADTLRTAVAGLPAGQRRAIALHYYADLPAGQIAEPAGAARASLHKARLKLRAYLIEHRPDLVPVASRRTPVTTVRVARVLCQEMFADDYRGAVVTFRGEFRTRGTAGTDTAERGAASRAGLFLRVVSGRDVRQPLTLRAAVNDPDNNIVTIPGDRDWTSCPVTARVPDDADTLVFGLFLAGHGRIEMRNVDLTRGA